MTTKQNDGDLDPENLEGSTDPKTPQTPAGSGSAGGPLTGYVSEESYKGLQRAAEKQKVKLETEIANMKERMEASMTELEEAKMLTAEKEKLERAQADLNTSLQAMQAERDKLTRQLNHQRIIMGDFPTLASLAAYIPDAETEDQFRANATSFSNALQAYLKSAMSSNFAGSTPPIGGGNQSANTGVVDSLWDDVYRLAGVPGKEREYEEAYAKLQETLKIH